MDSGWRTPALVLSLVLAGCGGGGADDEGIDPNALPVAENISFIDITVPVMPAAPGARHAAKLDACVWSGRRSRPCTLEHLPVIHGEQSQPDVDTIMGRVLVSHPWMASRFRQLLESMPPDMLLLFRPITAIVISRDVRPSFYWSYTGAIHLDPEFIWVTATERQDVSVVPDFRSNFGATLQFTMPWRYVKDDAPAYIFRPALGQDRPFEHVQRALADLLFHELGHANDYLQPSQLGSLRAFSSLYEYTLRTSIPRVGDALANNYPLQSNIMAQLAQVRFQGADSTPTLDALTPQTLHPHFSADGANDWYNYTSRAEDVAMLFEEVMMLRHFDIDRDVAVANKPTVANPTSADYIVAWGVRNRLGAPQVKARARFVTAVLLPEAQIDAFLDGLPAPTQMTVGASWLDNLVLGPAGAKPMSKAAREAADLPVDELPVGH